MSGVVSIRLSLSNAFLILGDQAVLVDTGRRKDGKRLLAALADSSAAGRGPALILHTHAHSDHCGGTRDLQEATGAPVAVGRADAVAMEEGRNQSSSPTSAAAKLLRWLTEPDFPPVHPDILVPEEMGLDAFGVEGTVVATPGHTAGSVSVILSGGEAIVGDLLMGGWLGGLVGPGRPRYPYYAADLNQIRAGIIKLLDLGATTFYVGHGGPIAADRVRTWLDRQRGSSG